jgi:hypothetical protein
MKLLLLFWTTVFSAISFAQNVGIGTASPGFPLDINGRARIRYNAGTAGIWFNKQDNSSPASFVGHINDTTFGIFDNSSNAWRFAFNHSKTNMGIGTLAPKFPLTFADGIGDKISLFGGSASTTAPHYGLGIQSALMQFYTDNSSADFAFGYGNSNAFTENFRLKGDGNMTLGRAIWASAANNRVIRFGDGDNVHIGEVSADDRMELKAAAFSFGPGKVQIQDGSEGAGKAFISDANGFGTWTNQAFTNVERFKVIGFGGVAIPATVAEYVPDFTNIIYNNGSNIVINLATNTITFNKAGLYRLEFDIWGSSINSSAIGGIIGYLSINGAREFIKYEPLTYINSTYREVNFHFTTDRYMLFGTVLKIELENVIVGLSHNYLAGYLIAE